MEGVPTGVSTCKFLFRSEAQKPRHEFQDWKSAGAVLSKDEGQNDSISGSIFTIAQVRDRRVRLPVHRFCRGALRVSATAADSLDGAGKADSRQDSHFAQIAG